MAHSNEIIGLLIPHLRWIDNLVLANSLSSDDKKTLLSGLIDYSYLLLSCCDPVVKTTLESYVHSIKILLEDSLFSSISNVAKINIELLEGLNLAARDQFARGISAWEGLRLCVASDPHMHCAVKVHLSELETLISFCKEEISGSGETAAKTKRKR